MSNRSASQRCTRRAPGGSGASRPPPRRRRCKRRHGAPAAPRRRLRTRTQAVEQVGTHEHVTLLGSICGACRHGRRTCRRVVRVDQHFTEAPRRRGLRALVGARGAVRQELAKRRVESARRRRRRHTQHHGGMRRAAPRAGDERATLRLLRRAAGACRARPIALARYALASLGAPPHTVAATAPVGVAAVPGLPPCAARVPCPLHALRARRESRLAPQARARAPGAHRDNRRAARAPAAPPRCRRSRRRAAPSA